MLPAISKQWHQRERMARRSQDRCIQLRSRTPRPGGAASNAINSAAGEQLRPEAARRGLARNGWGHDSAVQLPDFHWGTIRGTALGENELTLLL